ncbi:hypothetical protein GCM10022286_06610 [Gryllotalpicola daejeonensis]|uniref:GNAT family N-acetyltransferase n=1 Tax=Gryllotalpicola daejeonensis TaxID=993087 RepID=A0ABP7ZG36_9MICO
MTVSIREARDSDFFPWLSLYEGYASERGVELTEQRALQLWTWLSDPHHPETSLIALDEDGDVTGLVHFHTFPRPLLGETGVFIDAIHAREDTVAQELFRAVRDTAAAQGAAVIRWTQADGETLPRVLAEAGGAAASSAYVELQTTPQPA